jgi:hypothetical protein
MRARKRSVAAAPAAPAPLLSLPAEVLHKICAQLPPHSVSALARTCRSLHAFVSADDHLWLSLYRFRWDQPDARNAARPSVCSGGEPGPSARDVPLGKGKGKAHEQPAAAGDGMAAQVWRSDEQAKRLARAAAMVQRGTSNKLALVCGCAISCRISAHLLPQVAHYNETARALLSALHSRLARSGEPDAYNGVLPHSRTVRTFDALFGDDYEGVSAYAAWIYPREVVSTVATWQRPETAEAYANYKRRHAAHEAALRSHPPVSEGMSVRIRGSQLPAVRAVAQAHLAASTGAAARKAASQREARPVPGQRRSRRAAQAMVPEPLRPLFDHGDGSDDLPMTLEDIAPIDEQLAAELHVLHGLRELVTPARTYERGPAAGRRPCLPVLANHRLGVRASDARISVPGSVRSGSTLDDLEEAHYHRPPADARLAAPLHLLSQSGFSYGSRDAMAGDKRLRGRARRIVYSGARFGPENCFGPFLPYRPPAGANAFRVSDAGDDASDSEEEFLLEAPRVPFGSTKLSAEALGRLWEKPSEPDDAADASDNFEDNEREYSAWDTELELVDFSLGRHNGGMTAHELLHFWDDEEDDLHLFDTSPGIDEMTEGHDSQSESPDADSADGDAPPLLHPGLEEEAADYSSEESAVSSNADSSSSADSLLYPDEQDLITLAGQAAGSIPRRLMREALARGEVPEKRIDWVVVEALQVVVSLPLPTDRSVLTRRRCTPTSCTRSCTAGAPPGCVASPRRACSSRSSARQRTMRSQRTGRTTLLGAQHGVRDLTTPLTPSPQLQSGHAPASPSVWLRALARSGSAEGDAVGPAVRLGAPRG